MYTRHAKIGNVLLAMTLATGLALTMTSCGDGGEANKAPSPRAQGSSAPARGKNSPSPSPGSSPSHTLAEVKSNGITLDITSALRSDGGFLTVKGTVTNGTSGIWVGSEWASDETELKKNGGSLAGASIVDQAKKKRYLILRDTEGRCLCTKFEGGVNSGATTDWFAQFPAPPTSTTKVDFEVPSMPPAVIDIQKGQ